MNVQYLLLKINLLHVGVLSYKSWLMLLQNPVTISAFSAHPAQIHKAATTLTEKFQQIITPGLWWVVVPCWQADSGGEDGLTAHSSCLWSWMAALAEFSVLFPVGAERCRWSLSQSTSRLMCVHVMFPYDCQFYWSWECFPGRCFIEGVQINFSVTAFGSLFYLALPCLALPDVCT